MIVVRSYRYLSKRDKKALATLCERLGVSLLPVSNKAKAKALLHKGHEFFNGEPMCKHQGKFAFWTGCDVINVIHDIAHVLFLGAPLWKSIPEGVADFGDVRWGGKEEGPVMFLSVELARCLKDYGGVPRLLKEMEKFGYGFGNPFNWRSDAKTWFKQWRLILEPKQARKCKVYDNLRIEINFKNVTVARVDA
jgi:hypothetical protein